MRKYSAIHKIRYAIKADRVRRAKARSSSRQYHWPTSEADLKNRAITSLCEATFEESHRLFPPVPSNDPVDEFCSYYASIDTQVQTVLSDFDGVTSRVTWNFDVEAVRRLKTSLLMSDLTILQFGFGQTFREYRLEQSQWPPAFALGSGRDQVAFDDQGRAIIAPAYCMSIDPRVRECLNLIGVLAREGRILIQPTPVVWSPVSAIPEGNTQWTLLTMDTDLLSEAWTYQPEAVQVAIPFHSEIPTKVETNVATLSLPYLNDVPFDVLGKILAEEHDVIAQFRVAARQLIVSATSGAEDVADVQNDIVRPAVDSLSRRIKTISSTTALKTTGVAFSAVSLALFSSLLPPAALIGGTSAITAALVKTLVGYLKEKNDAKNNPYYLLWRLRNSDK